ncbi:MAG: diaminopimelate epimerase [Acidimicrobiales bacterium]
MRLSKHHGLGNDFLVLLDPDGTREVAPEEAVALCDRRTGIGADGFMRATPGGPGAQVTMELLNADGSSAEMSGNGVRCLAQAVFLAGLAPPPAVRVSTDAGLRTVHLVSVLGPRGHRMSVEMGQAKVVGQEPEWVDGDALDAVRVDVGNPHVVLRWGAAELPDRDELIRIGSRIDGATPGGANVEIVLPSAAPGELDMVVYERGVGPTLACGTGACAVAAAGRDWELSATTTVVHMPGGPAEISLGEPTLLTSDVTFIATIDTMWPGR